MRWINLLLIPFSFLFLSCDLAKAELDNCQDLGNYTVDLPGIGFCPELSTGSVNDNIELSISVLDITDAAGVHAQVNYDASMVKIISADPGDFFLRSQKPIFVYEDDGQGKLDIYVFFMSSEKTNSGTGQIADIIVKLLQPGSSEVSITTESEILDPKDVKIPIKVFGTGTINAQ